MANEHTAWIALGSNLGDRTQNIACALDRLSAAPGVNVLRVSTLHETRALILPGATAQPAYMNAVAAVGATLSPRSLLRALLAVEVDMGRQREAGVRWSARVIDLDLLLYEEVVLHEPGLVVPHPHMHAREFVLAPLAELAPTLTHPALGLTVEAMLAAVAGRDALAAK